ncbi:MAG: aldose 1-epimerase family protein [Ginsengibacter sp.]
MIQIQNNQLSVIINEKGAELQHIQLNGLEYLWQADAKYWGKHSPVLFPIVGELKDGKYIFENKEYTLSRHGFARDKVFEGRQTSDASAIFTLHSNDETLAVYPFSFIFQVQYEVRNNVLSCTYIVENCNDSEMYFSVGGHPAFRVPLSEDLRYADYSLQFDNDTNFKRYMLHNGLTTGDVQIISLDKNELRLDPSLFYEDAIVLKHLNSQQIVLHTDKDRHGLTFKFDGFTYFGIWASKDAPFVCLEPWCGIADNIQHDYQLTNKEGINQLAAGKTWQRTWSVELF